MAKADLYATLGVERDADSDAIRKAFRKLARKYHPDVNQNDPKKADRFKDCLLYTSPSPRDLSTSRMPSSA